MQRHCVSKLCPCSGRIVGQGDLTCLIGFIILCLCLVFINETLHHSLMLVFCCIIERSVIVLQVDTEPGIHIRRSYAERSNESKDNFVCLQYLLG